MHNSKCGKVGEKFVIIGAVLLCKMRNFPLLTEKRFLKDHAQNGCGQHTAHTPKVKAGI